MTTITNEAGTEIDFEAAAQLMDDEIRERLHMYYDARDEADFFHAYCQKHREQFGEEFEPNKRSPNW